MLQGSLPRAARGRRRVHRRRARGVRRRRRGAARAGRAGRGAHLGAGRQARLRHRAPARRATPTSTLRAASLSEVYYPDLSTPAFRGLQFAVGDGDGRLERETVDDDPAHIEPVAPGVRARVEPLDGALGFRQVTETRRWRLTKTWITDPARATVLARVRFDVARPAGKLKLYVLADPAPGDDGNDDRAREPPRRPASRGTTAAASAVAAAPGFTRTSSGYKGTESDPWQDLQDGAAARLGRGRARQRRAGRRDAAGRRAQARPDAGDRLRRRRGGGRRGTARASLDRGFPARRRALRRRLALVPALAASARPRSVRGSAALRRVYEQSLMVLAASEDKRERGASIAAPNMPWVWGTLTLSGEPRSPARTTSSGRATSTTSPRRRRRPATTPRPTRLLDYLWRVQKPDGSWWQNTQGGRHGVLDGPADGRGRAAGRARLVARPARRETTGARAARPPTSSSPTARRRRRSAGRTRTAGRRTRSPPRSPALICAADVARANGDPARAASYEATADEWQEQVEAWTATTNGPYSDGSVLPAPDQGRRTRTTGSTYKLGDNFPRPGGRARDRRQLVPRARAVRGQAVGRPDRAQLARGRRRAARVGHAERPDLAPVHRSTATARPPTAATGTSSRRRSARRSGACGRCSPASAASTSCSPAATPGRTCGRSRTPPTTG